MNRYMITREKIKGQEYLISALYDEKKHMIEVLPEAAGRHHCSAISMSEKSRTLSPI